MHYWVIGIKKGYTVTYVDKEFKRVEEARTYYLQHFDQEINSVILVEDGHHFLEKKKRPLDAIFLTLASKVHVVSE